MLNGSRSATVKSLESGLTVHSPDADLVFCALKGSDRAFEFIMQRNHQLLFRTARKILTTDADSEDAVQEAYLSAWRALARYRANAKLSTWLVRIVINESLGRLRVQNKKHISFEMAMASFDKKIRNQLRARPEDEPEFLAMRSQMRRILERHLQRLPEIYLSTFMLCVVHEMTASEAANLLQVPVDTVRTRLFRARGLLRHALTAGRDRKHPDSFGL